MKGVAPDAEFCFALTQKRTDKALKRLRQSGVRDVALGLVELPQGKKAAGRNNNFVQLIDDRRLTDAGIAGNQHQLRPAAFYDTIEASEQCLDFTIAAIQFLRDQKPVWHVMPSQHKLVDAAPSFPFSKTAPQISLDAGRRLVALLRRLGEQFHDDR